MISIVSLYWPATLSVILLIIAVKYKFREKLLFELKIGIVGLNIPVKSNIILRLTLIVLSFLCINYYLLMDYSSFFPDRLKMDVFYDAEGLNNNLEMFSEGELSELGCAKDGLKLSNVYYNELDEKLNEILKYDNFFSVSNGVVHSHGETSFEVSKVSGFQTYYLDESKGELSHYLEIPNKKKITFMSFFEKLPTSNDYFRPNLFNVIASGSYIMQPRFKQIIAENIKSEGVVFDHTLVGVTKIRFLPIPKIENTIYFYEISGKGLVPVAYAVYKY